MSPCRLAVPLAHRRASTNSVLCYSGEDGKPFVRSVFFGTQVTVIGGIVQTTVETPSLVMVAGGITPINLTIQSVRGGPTDVSYRLSGPTEFGLSPLEPPIHVDSGKTVRGTVWLEASLDAPQDATVQLTQFSFSRQGRPDSHKDLRVSTSTAAG